MGHVGWGAWWTYLDYITTHLRVKIREFKFFLYTDMATILDFSFYSDYYITLQIYFGYHRICISASSVPMNYFYLQQLFFGNFLKYVCGFFQIYGISR